MCERVCVREKEGIERMGVCVRERESVCVIERMCVRESVCVIERMCVCERERVRVRWYSKCETSAIVCVSGWCSFPLCSRYACGK